jgi:ankyrin repeat protein
VIDGNGGRDLDVKGLQHERRKSTADGEALRGRAKLKGPSEAQKIQKYMFEQMSFLLLFAAKNKVDDIALLVSDTERTRLRIAPKIKKVVMMADFEGRSALTVASLYGHVSSVSLLLQLKANPLHVDNRGLSPMDHAIMSGDPATAEVLRAAGGRPSMSAGKTAPLIESPPPSSSPQVSPRQLQSQSQLPDTWGESRWSVSEAIQ